MVPERQCPHPRRASRSCMDLEDAADNFTARKHVEIVLLPVAGRATCRCAFEDEVVLLHPGRSCRAVLERNRLATNSELRDHGPPLRVRNGVASISEARRSFVWSRSWPRMRIGKAT